MTVSAGEALAALLAARSAPVRGDFLEFRVACWDGPRGVLSDGLPAALSPSCTLIPAAGDRVLAWCPEGSSAVVLCVIELVGGRVPEHLLAGDVRVAGPSFSLVAERAHVQAREYLENVVERHSVARTSTEVASLRVSQLESDVRRASHVRDDVSGSFIQNAGVWLSSVARELRMHAKAMLFD